jgi:hypothetical protein
VAREIVDSTSKEILLSGIACAMNIKKAMMRNSNLFPLTLMYLAILHKVSLKYFEYLGINWPKKIISPF